MFKLVCTKSDYVVKEKKSLVEIWKHILFYVDSPNDYEVTQWKDGKCIASVNAEKFVSDINDESEVPVTL